MMVDVSFRIITGRQRNGARWAAKYPEKADDLYVVGQVGGKKKERIRIGPPTPENQLAAENVVREWERRAQREALLSSGLVSQSFAEAADAWLRQLKSRAPKTLQTRRYQVGVLEPYFVDLPLDQIGVSEITTWWDQAIGGGKRAIPTGKSYLDALSMIFKHAKVASNPVPAARVAILGDIKNTAGRDLRGQGVDLPYLTDPSHMMVISCG